jgi:hypothetical protein
VLLALAITLPLALSDVRALRMPPDDVPVEATTAA